MLFAMRWLYLTLVVLCTTVFAWGKDVPEDDCDWFCKTDLRLDALAKQVQVLYQLLLPDITPMDVETDAPSVRPSTTPGCVASTFGKQSTLQSPIVTASLATSGSFSQPTLQPVFKPAVEDRNGYRVVGYYGNWDVYARKFYPQQIPAEKLTHLLYSFADNKADGTVVFSDSYADTELHYQGDPWSESGKNVYGAVKQLGLLKQKNRNLKVMLSIGGWTYTNEKKHMDVPSSTAEGRKRFADSCVDMIKNFGFDGIDIDWEYPQSTEQGSHMLALLTAVRSALDTYADSLASRKTGFGKEPRPHFPMSIAAPAGKENYRNLPLGKISQVVDFINLMAYDYVGSWHETSGHASNLAASKSNPKSTPFNTDSVIQAYKDAGVPSNKIVLGMPLYGRGFANTAGLGQPYDGLGKGTWEAGVYDFKDLPLPGAKEYFDPEAQATYSYDNTTGTLISYDTVGMASLKAEYIKKGKLGGAMWWEVSSDGKGAKSIITTVVNGLVGSDGKGIGSRSNWLYYPDSLYDNIKTGFVA